MKKEQKKERNNILDNIVKIRKKKGLSQEYVGSKLGMGQSGYGLIEQGERGLQYDVLLQIATIFEMTIIDVITYPKKYIDSNDILENTLCVDEKVTLQIELKKEKKEQILKLVFGENNLEILNK
ncbi:MAG: helix-turn-helix domain-containing protein [Prevotellaceae bacterium]|jgi:transcriptional regulator with XRE-family HTH domain|nr:helix-turn-helix domain-containing protein [Prevotellaceae bacterium]